MSCIVLASMIALAGCDTTETDTSMVDSTRSPFALNSQSKFLAEHTNDWWKWAHAETPATNPVQDKSGIDCQINQKGNVWFLAGGFGSSEIRRTCTIPSDKYLFFPLINTIHYNRYQGNLSCTEAKMGAALNNDHLLKLEISLDGELLDVSKVSRVETQGCFTLEGYIYTNNQKHEAFPAASDGYWVMLKPLSAGQHTLSFRAAYNVPSEADRGFGRMVQDISYSLVIE